MSTARQQWDIRLSADELIAIERAAALAGLPARTWARTALLQAAGSIPAVDPQNAALAAALARMADDPAILKAASAPAAPAAPTPITPWLVTALSPKPSPRPLLAQPKSKRS